MRKHSHRKVNQCVPTSMQSTRAESRWLAYRTLTLNQPVTLPLSVKGAVCLNFGVNRDWV